MLDLVGNSEDRFSHNEAQITFEEQNMTVAELANTVHPYEMAQADSSGSTVCAY